MKIKLRIFRGRSQTDDRYDTFEIDASEGMTILSALNTIKENYDPTLAFKHFCRAGICGTCTIMINGFPKLACREQLYPYAVLGGEITLEPLKGYPLLKDLAVDHEPVVKRLKDIGAWIEDGKKIEKGDLDLWKRIDKASDCILCAACQSYCPQVFDDDYLGPLFFAKLYRFIEDPRDENTAERINIAVERGKLYHCLSCNKCNNVCPREVEPATLIRELMVHFDEDGEG